MRHFSSNPVNLMSLKEAGLLLLTLTLGAFAGGCGLGDGGDASRDEAIAANAAVERIHEDAGSDSTVDYGIEFLPYRYNPDDEVQPSGVLLVSHLSRPNRDAAWRVERDADRRIAYPKADGMSQFVVRDYLAVPDELEGVRLCFYDDEGHLLRSVSYSIEEWLYLIGEIRRSSLGYLNVDLSGQGDDLIGNL
jgi:hypothetical protein